MYYQTTKQESLKSETMRKRPIIEIACNILHEDKILASDPNYRFIEDHCDLQPKQGAAVEIRTKWQNECINELTARVHEEKADWQSAEDYLGVHAGKYAEGVINLIKPNA